MGDKIYSAENREEVLRQLSSQIVLDDAQKERLRAMSPQEFYMYVSLTPHVLKQTEATRKRLDGLYAYHEAKTPEGKVRVLKSELEVCGSSGTGFRGLTPGTPEYVEKELVSLEGLWLVEKGRLELSV